jgi:hypothetical protein
MGITYWSVRIVIATAFAVLGSASNASAVCVTDGQGPCFRFWKVDAVFVAKLTAKERHQPGDPFAENYRLQVIVVEAFRGVAQGARLTLFASDGVCGGVNAEDGGELFVYGSRNENGELWAQGCGESKPLEDAEADLAYARSVNEGGPAALVYGDVHQVEDVFGDARDFSVMGGVLVRVIGKNFVAEALTDADGNYAITLPGSGSYKIEALPPDGFAYRIGGAETFEIGDRRSCYRAPFQLKLNGRIRGRVVDDDDQPIANLIVRVGDSEQFAKTSESGEFEIGPLSEGSYSVVAQTGTRVVQFHEAELIKIRAGEITVVPPLKPIELADLATLVIDVDAAEGGEVFVLVESADGAQTVGGPISAGVDPIRILVENDQSFKVVAASMTHEAKTIVRSRSPETFVTLTLRRRSAP